MTDQNAELDRIVDVNLVAATAPDRVVDVASHSYGMMRLVKDDRDEVGRVPRRVSHKATEQRERAVGQTNGY